MFIEVTLDLGVLGHHEALASGSVERDEFCFYSAKLKSVSLDIPGLRVMDVTTLLKESEVLRIEQRLINKYIAAEARTELLPEDHIREVIA